LWLALPAVGEQVLNTLVGLSDTFLVGHLSPAASARVGYSSSTALAGVGLANQIVWLITVFFMAVSVGSTALIARARGAGDYTTANRVMRQSLVVGLIMGVLASLLGVLLAEPAIQLLGADADVLPRGVTFLRIASSTFAPAALLFIGMAALRGAGDTRWPLYTKLISIWGVRLPLVILLLPLGLGLTGIWVAICTDFAVQALLAFWQFRRGRWKTLRV